MSDGMSDAAAESRIYRTLWTAVYDLRAALVGQLGTHVHLEERPWPAGAVRKVNEIIRDTGYEFRLARYAMPNISLLDERRVIPVWDAAFRLRRALGDSHRGWRIVPDLDVDGLLLGSRYELVNAR